MAQTQKDAARDRVIEEIEDPQDPVLSGLVSRFGSDTLKYLPSVVIPAVASFLGVAIFTRIFSADAYGEYSLVFIIVSVATSVLSVWLQQSVLRYLPRYRTEGRIDEFLARFGAILYAFAFVALVVLLLGWPVHSLMGTTGRYYLVAAFWTISGFVFFVQSHAFRATFQSVAYTRYQVLYAVARLALPLVYFYIVSRDVIGLMIGSAAAYVIFLLPMAIELGMARGVKASGFSIDFAFLKKLYSYGFPLVGTVIGVKILDVSDRFVIQHFRGAEEVGIYSANYTLVTMGVLFVATPLLSAAVPLIVQAWEGGAGDRIHSVISSFSRYYLIMSVPVVAFTIVFAREIATVLLGREFREGYTITPYVLLGALLWNFATYGHKGIKLLEKTRVTVALVSVCCVVNIVLNLILVPKYGYQGAAVSTLVGYALYPVLVYWIARRYLEWRIPWRSVFNITSAALVGSLVWWGSKSLLAERMNVVLLLGIALVLGSAAYLAALAVVGELGDRELRAIGIGRRGK